MRGISKRTPIEPEKGDKHHRGRKRTKRVKSGVSAGRALAIDRPHKAKNEASATGAINKRKHSRDPATREGPA